MKQFLPSFSTNISFAQKNVMMSTELLILQKMDIALKFFEYLYTRIYFSSSKEYTFLPQKSAENAVKASGFKASFLNAMEMISSGWEGMFQTSLITIHNLILKGKNIMACCPEGHMPLFSCKSAQGAFHRTPAWIILLLAVMSEWANTEVIDKKCCQHGTAVFSL